MKAKGCKHLEYDETKYSPNCSIVELGGEHANWERKECDPFSVQFCDLRGRLNQKTACTRWELKQCYEYEEQEHEVIFRKSA